MDKGTWWATVHGVTESDMTERDSLFSFRISVCFHFKVLTFLVKHAFCSLISYIIELTFVVGSDGKASAYNVGDLGSIPRLERSLGEGNGNPLQYSCLENPMDGGTR